MRKQRINLGVGVPSYTIGCAASYPLQCLSHSDRIGHHQHFEQANSLLASNCNMLWCQALNAAKAGSLTHYLQIHADVRPRAQVMEHWFDVMLEEMEKADADVLAASIPIKNNAGYTSTALDTDRWSPQRLTQLQMNRQLPVTWTSPTLLFNTGLMLVDLRGDWTANPPFFTINDEIVQNEEGLWVAHCEPEDWNFSRQCHERGMRCFVTRAIPIEHFGVAAWSSDGIWGHEVDPECARLSHEITLIDAAGEFKRYTPAEKEELLNGSAQPR